jgi:two-component system, NarL family, nitrate/nitrite response regulator NarL
MSKKPHKIRLLLVDDHPIVLEGIRSQLTARAEFDVVGTAADGQEALAKARALQPDIILLDISMPGMNGLETLARLRKTEPHLKVLMLTMHGSREYIAPLMTAGVSGYVLKDCPPTELVNALKLIAEGQVYFSPRVSKVMLDELAHGRKQAVAPDDVSRLSEREREVLKLIADGCGNKQIAIRLQVGVRTVETHRERIMNKLQIHSVAGLTRFAISQGLVEL